jgi:energy-coupling factor transport system ATP-binding protein
VSPERHEELLAADEAREEDYGETLIEVEGLSTPLPERIDGPWRAVDLEVRQGEFLAILGQNGSGKDHPRQALQRAC